MTEFVVNDTRYLVSIPSEFDQLIDDSTIEGVDLCGSSPASVDIQEYVTVAVNLFEQALASGISFDLAKLILPRMLIEREDNL